MKLPTIALLCVVTIYGLFALYRLGWPDLEPDEGRYGLVASNIMTDYHQLATLSEDPLGVPGTKPFMYGACLAPFLSIFGRGEFALRLCSVLALLASGLFVFEIVNSYFHDQMLSLLTLFFFLVSPWTLSYAHKVMPEGVMVFWGCLALFAASRYSQGLSWPWALISGVALGCSFLSKLWLSGSFALACLVIFIGTQNLGSRQRVFKAGLLAACGATATAISHLLLVLWLTPADLDHWLHIYFVVSFAGRTTGVGYDPGMWFRPWWFYCAGVFKATFFGMPLILVAAYTMLRKGDRIVIAVLAALLLSLPMLSLFTVKQTSYVYPVFPALAFMLAYGCLIAFRTWPRNVLLVAIGISALMIPLFYECQALDPKQAAAVLALYLLYAFLAIAPENLRTLSVVSFVTAALAALFAANIAEVRVSLDHRTYYRELADYFRPALVHVPPQEVVFVAPEFAALEFHLFRTGQYWQTFYFHEDDEHFLQQLKRGAIAFYIVDPNDGYYGGKASAQKLNALHEYGVDETSKVEHAVGRQIPFQVFVPRSWLTAPTPYDTAPK